MTSPQPDRKQDSGRHNPWSWKDRLNKVGLRRGGWRWARRKLRKLRPRTAVGWAAILVYLLVGWASSRMNTRGLGFFVMPAFAPDRCAASVAEPSNWTDALVHPFLRVVSSNHTPEKVVVVTISPDHEPELVQNNLCRGREFMANLVHDLDEAGAKVIAIDKFYADSSCEEGGANRIFTMALSHTNAAVVIGQSTHERTGKTGDGDCLVENPTYDFKKNNTTPFNDVSTGLSRLDSDTERVPLDWWVFHGDAEAKGQKDATTDHESFALVAARHFDPSLGRKRDAIDLMEARFQHPLAQQIPFENPLNAIDVMCTMEGASGVDKDEWNHEIAGGTRYKCPKSTDTMEQSVQDQLQRASTDKLTKMLKGKLVVVGQLSEEDRQFGPTGNPYGTHLQASYMENLVQGHVVQDAAWWWQWLLCGPLLYGLNKANGAKPKAIWPVALSLAALGLLFAIWLLLLKYQWFAAFVLLNIGFIGYIFAAGLLRIAQARLKANFSK